MNTTSSSNLFPQGKWNLHALPVCLLAEIFSALSQRDIFCIIARICSRFHRVLREKTVWKEKNLEIPRRKISSDYFAILKYLSQFPIKCVGLPKKFDCSSNNLDLLRSMRLQSLQTFGRVRQDVCKVFQGLPITYLTVNFDDEYSLSGLEHFPLAVLSVENPKSTDLLKLKKVQDLVQMRIIDFKDEEDRELISTFPNVIGLQELHIWSLRLDMTSFVHSIPQDLTYLSLDGVIIPDPIVDITSLKHLETLLLTDCGKAVFIGIEHLQNLKTLELCGVRLDSPLKVGLLTNLEELNFQCRHTIDFTWISNLHELRKLTVYSIHFIDKDFAFIDEKSFPYLESLNLMCLKLNGECFKYFKYLPSLISLEIEECPIEPAHLQYLEGLLLEKFEMVHRGYATTAPALETHPFPFLPNIKEIQIWNSSITDTWVKSLPLMSTLRRIRFHGLVVDVNLGI